MKHVYEVFANLIIDGRFSFKDLAKKFKPGVKAALKEKGREDLATESSPEV